MHVVIPHQFSQKAAVERVKQGLRDAAPHLKDQAQIERQEWQGDTLAFTVVAQKQRIEGTLAVEDKQFVLEAKLPLIWRLFEGKIEKMITEQVASMQK